MLTELLNLLGCERGPLSVDLYDRQGNRDSVRLRTPALFCFLCRVRAMTDCPACRTALPRNTWSVSFFYCSGIAL
jgi:hypothetical protein